MEHLLEPTIKDISEKIKTNDIKWLKARAKTYQKMPNQKSQKRGKELEKIVKDIEELLTLIQTSDISEQIQKYKDDVRKYQYLLLETLDYTHRLVRTLEERDKVFSLRDVFLPVQLILGNLHGGMDVSVEKEQLAVQLKNIIDSPIPEPESEKDPIICNIREKAVPVWDSLEDAKAAAKMEWNKLNEIMQPPIYSRQLIEKLAVLFIGSECCEDAIKTALESCGIFVKYYEEANEEMKCYFAKREHGLPYPGLFVLGHDGKLQSQRGGTYIVKEGYV